MVRNVSGFCHESEILWQALKAPQETVIGKRSKEKYQGDAIAVQRQLSALQPKNNTKFDHLRLMNDQHAYNTKF